MTDNNSDHRDQNTGREQPVTKAGTQPQGRSSRRGFAAMDEQTQRAIASKGGHSQGKENNLGNFWHDRERARTAGRKGGEAHGKNRQEPPNADERQ
jgi:general stress protein YciG